MVAKYTKKHLEIDSTKRVVYTQNSFPIYFQCKNQFLTQPVGLPKDTIFNVFGHFLEFIKIFALNVFFLKYSFWGQFVDDIISSQDDHGSLLTMESQLKLLDMF